MAAMFTESTCFTRYTADRNSAFGVRRSAFGVRRSAFGVRRSAFGVRRSALGVRRSAFGVRRSAFCIRRSAFAKLSLPGCLSAENKVLCSRKLLFLRWKLSLPVNMVSEVDEHLPKVRRFRT